MLRLYFTVYPSSCHNIDIVKIEDYQVNPWEQTEDYRPGSTDSLVWKSTVGLKASVLTLYSDQYPIPMSGPR